MKEILYDVADGLASITLNRPDKLNSFTKDMLDGFNRALSDAASSDTVRAVLVTGSGKAFCAGQDLGDRTVRPGDEPPDLGESLEHRYNPAIRAMRSMPQPVVVAVNGVAAGAGANIALAGDVVIAARSARFIQAFARLGLIPDSGGTFLLPRSIGMPRALGLSLLAKPIDADTAVEWGMIWAVVDDDILMDEATRTAEQLAAGPTAGYAAIKEALNASLGNTLDEQLDLERDLQQTAGRTDDYREGVEAFLGKRAPRFRGR